MKVTLVVAALLATSVAAAERAKEPPHHKQARTFLKTLLESKDNPPASAAKPVAVYLENNSNEAACKGVGDVKDAAGMTKLKTCMKAIKKAFTDKVDEVGVDDIKASKFLDDFPPPVLKEVKGMVKNARLVQLGFNGNGETLFLTVALAKDGTVKSLFQTSEAVE